MRKAEFSVKKYLESLFSIENYKVQAISRVLARTNEFPNNTYY